MRRKGYREVEKKFVVRDEDNPFTSVARMFYHLPRTDVLSAVTSDTYWTVPGKANFLRLRHSRGEDGQGKALVLKEITSKTKDRESNLDRLEINLEIVSVEDARQLLRQILGAPVGEIHKHEDVYFLNEGVVLSVCKILNSPAKTYVEIEGPSIAYIDTTIEKVSQILPLKNQETRSLFEIYLAGDK